MVGITHALPCHLVGGRLTLPIFSGRDPDVPGERPPERIDIREAAFRGDLFLRVMRVLEQMTSRRVAGAPVFRRRCAALPSRRQFQSDSGERTEVSLSGHAPSTRARERFTSTAVGGVTLSQ